MMYMYTFKENNDFIRVKNSLSQMYLFAKYLSSEIKDTMLKTQAIREDW